MKRKDQTILDLTKPLDSSLVNYTGEGYADPVFSCVEWSSVANQGFRVSALSLGTQTGTHIDAPAHFDVSGECINVLPLEELIGSYFLIDLPQDVSDHELETICGAYNRQEILFVRTPESGVTFLSRENLTALLNLPVRLWVLAGEIKLAGGSPLEFHRTLARCGKYLVEDLNLESARKVRPGGEVIVLPLRLVGTSGAPCRIVIRQSVGIGD
jgi:kynurenine formamidase